MATAATVQAILGTLPGFSYAGAAATFIDASMLESIVAKHPDSVWGTDANLAAALLIAHDYTVMARGANGPTGPRISDSAGGVSQAYQAPYALASSPELRSTPYGVQYLTIRGRIFVGPIVM